MMLRPEHRRIQESDFRERVFLRFREKTVRGDHYVTLVVQVPEKISKEAKTFLRNLMNSEVTLLQQQSA